MADYDNTITLYDEDGNEVKFEVVHYAQYKGETYLVLWSEDSDAMPIVVERNGDYEVVDDNDALNYVRASFAEDMVDLKLEIESLSDDLEELIEHADDLLDEDIVTTDDENVSELESSISPVEFDYNKYILQSQDYLFKKALITFFSSSPPDFGVYLTIPLARRKDSFC